jgi:hypothetical protein
MGGCWKNKIAAAESYPKALYKKGWQTSSVVILFIRDKLNPSLDKFFQQLLWSIHDPILQIWHGWITLWHTQKTGRLCRRN